MIDHIRADPLSLRLTWREERLESIKLEWSGSQSPRRRSCRQSPWGRPFQEGLQRYLAREDPAWPDVPLAGHGLSDFAWKVLRHLRTVPTGDWRGYGRLAAECGHPGAARAVGRVMARNPWPLLFPCHRVLGGSGQLTGFGPGLDLKRFLLVHEGIPFAGQEDVPLN